MSNYEYEPESPDVIAEDGWTDEGEGYEEQLPDPAEWARAVAQEEVDAWWHAQSLTDRNDQLQAELDEAEAGELEEEEREPLRTGLDGLYGGANPFDVNDELPSAEQIRGLSFRERDLLEENYPGIIAQCQAKWQWEIAKRDEGGRAARRAEAEANRLAETEAAQRDGDYQLEVARQNYIAERHTMTEWNRGLLGPKLGLPESEW